MLAEPRVVGRALQREVERELHPVPMESVDEDGEVGLVAEGGVDRVVPALGGSDRPRASDVPGPGALGVVPPLAVRPADRVDRRQVHDVEAELGERGNHLGHACEAAPGAREQLVPGAGAGALTFDLDLEWGSAPRRSVAIPCAEGVGGRPPVLDGAVAEQRLTLGELTGEVLLPRRELPVVLVEPARVSVDPGLDLEAIAPDGVHCERAGEAVVAEEAEPLLAPAASRLAISDRCPQRLVAVAHDRGRHFDTVSDARLGGPASAIDARCHIGDRDPLGRHRRDTVNSPP